MHVLRPLERVVGLAHGVFYLQSLAWLAAAGVVALTWPLAGSPAVLHGNGPLLMLAPVAAIVLADLYRQRFYLDPRERGLHWPGSHAGPGPPATFRPDIITPRSRTGPR